MLDTVWNDRSYDVEQWALTGAAPLRATLEVLGKLS